MVFSFSNLNAQSDIFGKIVDENKEPLPFANILIKGSTTGTTSDFDGNFSLNKVSNTDVLIISMLGFKTKEIIVGSERTIEIILIENAESLDEIVVTGVAVGTSVKKLAFALSKVNKEQLKEVPAADLGNALRGKVAGVRIVQANGDPNTAASIRLRGSNSLMGSQDPLIIIDGVITGSGTNLRDINMEDVESIEVIKGAAASSLYGSLSGNGVIQIITKRGRNTNGVPTLTVRNEIGFSQIVNKYPLANTHRYKLRDPSLHPWNFDDFNEQGRWELSGKGIRVAEEDGLLDNPFPRVLDNQAVINTAQPVNTVYTSLSSGNENFKYHLSFQNSKSGGAIEGIKPNIRNNSRMNIDYMPNEKFSIKNSFSYSTTEGHIAPSSTRVNGLRLEPWLDITEKDIDDNYLSTPKGSKYLRDGYLDNPLYEVNILENNFNRKRLMFSPDISYRINDNLRIGASYSYDKSREETYYYTPKGYEDPDPEREDGGEYGIENDFSTTAITQAFITYNKRLGKFNNRITAKFLRENRLNTAFYGKGEDLSVGGVLNLAATKGDSRTLKSYKAEEKVSNFFVDYNLDYDDKIIFNGLIRRDGSSLFGENNRWQTFGRVSLAYIVSEDFEIKNVDDLKVRFSWGVSGQRPRFNAQYETYTFDSRTGVIERGTLGNKNLLPSKVSEWEAGLNVRLFNKINLEVNYAETIVKNDFIKAPIPGVLSGFTEQWKNIGGIKSSSFEVQVGGDIIRTDNFKWNLNVSWDKVTQEISDLGGLAPFNRSRRLFRVEEGKPYGLMYGYKIIDNINDLSLNNNGFVLNDLGSKDNNDLLGTLKPSDFETNEHGYVVRKNTEGTKNEQVILLADEQGVNKKVALGNTNPDWNLGLSSNFSYKNFNLYFVIDHQHGGQIYNSTKQDLYRRERHGDQETFAKQGKHILYSNDASNLDFKFNDTSHFVEDGTFTKLREVALGYTLNEDALGENVGKYIKQLKFSLIGRNLLTITNYSGFDPEAAYIRNSSRDRGNGPSNRTTPNPTNDRIDRRAYPQFRTFTAMIQLKF